MKYVRTKDGIYKAVLFSPLGFVRIDKGDGTYPDIPTKNLVGNCTADNIEELIDLYVIVTEDGRHITMSVDKAVADLEDNYLRKYYFIKGDYVIYGAIYTDKGLIYVAKMNDKGELELL